MNNNLLVKTAIKWGGLYGALSVILGAIGMLVNGVDFEVAAGSSIFFTVITSLSLLIFMVFFAIKAIQEYEGGIKRKISLKEVWKMMGIYFLILTIIDIAVGFGTSFAINSSVSTSTSTLFFASIIGNIISKSLFLIVTIYYLGKWKTFKKAGLPGWSAFIPFYNLYQLTVIGRKEGWWVLMLFIPLINIIFSIMIVNGVSKAFGKEEGFTVGLFLLPFIFYPILGFGEDRWIYGPEVEEDDFVPNNADILDAGI